MQLLATAWWFIFNKNDRVFASIREQAAQAQHPHYYGMRNRVESHLHEVPQHTRHHLKRNALRTSHNLEIELGQPLPHLLHPQRHTAEPPL